MKSKERKSDKMKLDCEIIKDLLPLYIDNVCSEASKTAVEEHLKECESCGKELEAMKDSAPTAFSKLEKGAVIIGKYRSVLLSKIVFFFICVLVFPAINGIFAAAIGEAVWENVIFTLVSMFTFVYIPAAVQKKRFVRISVSSVLAPIIIMRNMGMLERVLNYREYFEHGAPAYPVSLIPSCLYIVLSLVMFFVNRKKEPIDPLKYRTAAFKIVMIETFCLYYCGYISTATSMSAGGFSDVIKGTANITFPVIFLWLAFLVFRFCKKNIFIRFGAYSIIFGIFISNCFPLWESVWSGSMSGIYRHYSPWLTIITVSLIVAAIFIVTGIIWEKGKKNQ